MIKWLVLSSIFLLGPTASCRLFDGPAASSDPAIFLIVVDTLRADHVSIGSYEISHTPNIGRLSTIGTQFSTARAVASWTNPSMGAMMTSLYPSQLGLVEAEADSGRSVGRGQRRDQLAWTLPPAAHTMAERLHSAGLRTAAFVNQPGLNNEAGGFVQGFDDWFTPLGGTGEIVHLAGSDAPESHGWVEGSGREYLRIDRNLAGAFDQWLAAEAGQAMFGWVHLLTPHKPYVARLESEKASGSTIAERYAAEVRAVDAVVGEILDSIDRHVGLDRAHVFFTADHGEALGERGAYGHGHNLHSEVMNVPLIIASPSLERGAVVDSTVRTIDILPTMLEIAAPEHLESSALQGKSLLSFAYGDRASRDTYAEGMLYGPSERSLISDGFKLLYDAGRDRYALYDTRQDPDEAEDLASTQPERLRQMREALEAQIELLKASSLTLTAGRAEERPAAPLPESVEAALQALGYTE